MASLKDLRAAAAQTISANISGINGYARIKSRPALPAVLVRPAEADFLVTFGRGVDTWNLDLLIAVPTADLDVAQDLLDELVTGAGDRSIRQVIWQNRTLGLPGTDAHVAGMTGYGLTYEWAGAEHLGASLRLVAHTDGTQ